MTARHDPVDDHKDGWRRRLLAARRALTAQERLTRDAALAAGAARLVAGTVCAYHPVGTEPGGPDLVAALVATGARVLLPVVTGGPLDWADAGELAPAAFGLQEPVGPRLGPAMIREATLVLVPALGADRSGTRLGRGKGHYDRTLPLAAPGTRLVVLLGDGELVERLPVEPHDRPVTHALLPEGLVTLGKTA
jgi:5-formyltetrahydrofolate cyclo-ligase